MVVIVVLLVLLCGGLVGALYVTHGKLNYARVRARMWAGEVNAERERGDFWKAECHSAYRQLSDLSEETEHAR